MTQAQCCYFDAPNREDNTARTLNLAKQRGQALGIHTAVVASTTGWTALKAIEALPDFRLIVVAHSTGFLVPNEQEFSAENQRLVREKGGTLLIAAHAFGGLSRALRQGEIKAAPATYVAGDLVAATLRLFGSGVKVACEIGCMAVDAGLIPSGQEVILIAGTAREGGGANTAIVASPEAAHRFFAMQVREILCKPRYG